MPLSLQYDLAEPNSAWNWLERWSLSHFWKPSARPRKLLNAKPQKKQGGSQNVENETGKSKRTIRKASTADNGAIASSEIDKPKRDTRKVSTHQTDPAQEQHQNELERVKRNMRKVSASITTETEKPQSVKTDVSEQEIAISDVLADKLAFLEPPSETTITDDPVETHLSENGEKIESIPFLQEELCSKEDENGKESEKIGKRRSLPAKQEYLENISQNTPSLPSYMAATESAKAKLRAQGSSKLSEDGGDHGYVRRHSLPASTNGKLSSLSPRIQKPVQANGKGSSKINKSTTSSRDDKILVQPGWRR